MRTPTNIQDDAEVRWDVIRRIRLEPYDTSNVDVDVCAGEVVLRGRVRAHNERRRIETIAERAFGVVRVINEIGVVPERRPGRDEDERAPNL